MHLHHLLFYFLKKKNKKTFICNNTLAGSIINSYNLISFAVASKFYYHTEYLTYITSFNVLFYTAVYFYFYKKIKKNNNFINIKLNWYRKLAVIFYLCFIVRQHNPVVKPKYCSIKRCKKTTTGYYGYKSWHYE